MLANDGVSETVPNSRPAPRKTGVTTLTCFMKEGGEMGEEGGGR